MRFFTTLFITLFVFQLSAQENSFPFGQVTLNQLLLKQYDKDSTASAVVLKEFGESYISSESGRGLIFDHHYIIKILKPEGLKEADIMIWLQKFEAKNQKLVSIKASSYNFENGAIQESKANSKNIFNVDFNKNWDQKKLTIPNVRVGSVIEVQYVIDDPFFLLTFHPWNFQSHLPKVSSEYWATIPANYNYNIVWQGPLPFTRNEGKLLKDCYDLGGRYKADCARYFFLMENIPAFIEEEYMTAKSNFIASVNFELSEVRYFDGRVDNVTRSWEDVQAELKSHPDFGVQLKKGKEIFQAIEPTLAGIADSTERARAIYSFLNNRFRWNEVYGMQSHDGIKKAFENKTGTVADINLSLVAALRQAGFNVEPVVLSTRANGLPTELHPVLSDFNYVIAKINVGGKSYLLDATDPFLPFGMLPERCLNGKGRAFPDRKASYWVDLKPSEKEKTVLIMDFALQSNGKITGTMEFNYSGYSAYDERRLITSYETTDKFVEAVKSEWDDVTVLGSEITGVNELQRNVKEKYTVEIEGNDDSDSQFILNPFFGENIEKNPFRLSERLYPVDFGATPDRTIIANLSYPNTFELISKPEKNVYMLPGGAGKFLFDISEGEGKLTMNFVMSINKPVFSSNEYAALKEFYNRIIQTQQTDLIFRKKN